jgi:hypothetical protein
MSSIAVEVSGLVLLMGGAALVIPICTWCFLFGDRLGESFDRDAVNTPTTLDILLVLDFLLMMLAVSLPFSSSDASSLLLVGMGRDAGGRW